MLREWASKFSRSVNKRVVARRRRMKLPIKISIEPDRNTGNLKMPSVDLTIKGETHDLSLSGIAFIVSSIRVREFYLVGDGRLLNAEVTLPDGKITMQMRGERYEQVGNHHLSVTEYLVGARILQMSEEDRELYREFLRGKRQKAGSLELGIDKGKA